MDNQLSNINRRGFVAIGALAATAGLFPSLAGAAEPAVAPYKLPDLPYGFDALEPHIDAKTMEIHHGKHHAAYIKNLNTALESNADLAKKPLGKLLGSLSDVKDDALRATIRNNGGGHWNHAFFWETLAPASKAGDASKELAAAIDASFSSLDGFKKAFGEAAAKRFGSGWAWLIVQDGKLKITSTPNQDNPAMEGLVDAKEIGTPILGLDVWEHAYYLHYQNKRPDYVAAWWNVVNWTKVSERFAAAKG